MNLFVIGNGFDIGHKLETRYMEFRKFLEENYLDFLIRFEDAYGLHPENQYEYAEKILWKEFENNLSEINEDEIVGSGASLELGLEGGDTYIEDTLDLHWEEIYGFVKELSNYLRLWIETIDVSVPRKTTKINKTSNDLFLSFNYTLLLEEVYEIEKNRILHIHGSLGTEDYDSLIIGHGNSEKISESRERARKASENFFEKESSIYNAVANYYERTLKNVSECCLFNNFFFKDLNNIEKVLIVGHSLGDVDIPYFKLIKHNVKSNTIWCIYYYDDKEKYEFQTKLQSIGIKSHNIQTIKSKYFFNC
ncbi:bacteriophage abortive infection AbiH family protein [Carnobacterium mobile]|uniref:bacteriophage abortive infection AbiH family protein n=1 Tax=Carnobacterium mobile TaxID=2750 RepID=UPI00186646C7|nr:bacteriophage abortive infection AbiH family protein [Carnobacterium mobile]